MKNSGSNESGALTVIETLVSSIHERQKSERRSQRKVQDLHVKFPEDEEQLILAKEFDPENSALSITDPSHEGEPHDQIPWDEADYEEIPWWDQPDLDEDDEITALCKKILLAGGRGKTGNHEIQADKIHSLVIKFALKVKARIEDRGSEWRVKDQAQKTEEAKV